VTEVNTCETSCPISAARNLGELATQLVPDAYQWLFADDRARDGLYSPDAVRTAGTYFNVSTVPENPQYGTPRDTHDKDLARMREMQDALGHGGHVNPDEVTLLQRIATDREAAVRRHLNLSVGKRAALAERARPLLDRAAATLMSLDPELAGLQEIIGGADLRDNLEATRDAALTAAQGIHRLYITDQAPFIVASQAIKACAGPVPFAYKPLLRKAQFVFICPNGKRTDRYYDAMGQQSTAPPEAI
jgi:hypothetical protein